MNFLLVQHYSVFYNSVYTLGPRVKSFHHNVDGKKAIQTYVYCTEIMHTHNNEKGAVRMSMLVLCCRCCFGLDDTDLVNSASSQEPVAALF